MDSDHNSQSSRSHSPPQSPPYVFFTRPPSPDSDAGSTITNLFLSLAREQRLQLQTLIEQSNRPFRPPNQRESLYIHLQSMGFYVESHIASPPTWGQSSVVSVYSDDGTNAYYDSSEVALNELPGEEPAEGEYPENGDEDESIEGEPTEEELTEAEPTENEQNEDRDEIGFTGGTNTNGDESERNTQSPMYEDDEIDEYLIDLAYFFAHDAGHAIGNYRTAATRVNEVALELERAVQKAHSITLDAENANIWAETYAELSILEAAQAAVHATHLTSTAEMAVRVAELLQYFLNETEETAEIALGIKEDVMMLLLIAWFNACQRSATTLPQASLLQEARETADRRRYHLIRRFIAERRR